MHTRECRANKIGALVRHKSLLPPGDPLLDGHAADTLHLAYTGVASRQPHSWVGATCPRSLCATFLESLLESRSELQACPTVSNSSHTPLLSSAGISSPILARLEPISTAHMDQLSVCRGYPVSPSEQWTFVEMDDICMCPYQYRALRRTPHASVTF